MMGSRSHPVILYDGVCGFCDAAVRFVINHDPTAHFRFASLQSDTGARLASDAGIDLSALNTLVLVTETGALVRSDAVLEIARRLGPPWSLLAGSSVLPRHARDAVYRLVARHRLRLFGRLDACRILTPELRARLLDF